MARVPKVDDKMAAGIAQSVALDKIFLCAVADGTMARFDLRSGPVRLRFGTHSRFSKEVVPHRSLPQASNELRFKPVSVYECNF